MNTSPRELALALAAVTVVADAAKARKDDLREQLLDALNYLGADSAKALLPDGSPVGKASIVAPQPSATVTDVQALAAHLMEDHPDEVVYAIREAFQRAFLGRLIPGPDGDAIDPDTGEVIPGVKFRERTAYASMRFDKGGREAVIEAIQTGALPIDLTAPTPALEG